MTIESQDRRKAIGAMVLGTAGIAAMSSQAEAARPAASGGTMEQRLDRIASHQEIEDVLYRYARGWDRYDEEALRSCFWPDSQHEHGSFKGKSQDFISKAWPYIGTISLTTHAISNVQILIDGNRAMSECYFAAHHQRPSSTKDGDEDYFVWGRYLDRFERRGGEWKIAFRHGLSETEQVLQRNAHLSKVPPEQLSRRKPADPLYAMMDDFKAGR
jgi:3-phenylpropionate/cinnamic acid dioxygenase small subunit